MCKIHFLSSGNQPLVMGFLDNESCSTGVLIENKDLKTVIRGKNGVFNISKDDTFSRNLVFAELEVSHRNVVL